MENLIKLNVLTERPVIRNDQISEMDIVVEVITGTIEDDKKALKKQNLNLAIVIDRSGSMSGTKLETAKKSCIEVYKRLTENDLFTVIVYDENAEVIINPQTHKEEIINKIQGIQTGGMTNLSLGWYLGLIELQTYIEENRINKLTILSDGLANAGETKKSILGKQSSKMREDFGIVTSSIGIGEDFDEELLDILATESGGRFWYINDTNINEIIEEEFIGTLNTLIESPKIELNFSNGLSISKELNDLRKISGKYTLKPITGSYENCFAIRFELNPELIEEEAKIEAVLYNRGIKIKSSAQSLELKSFEEFIASSVNQEVLATVSKYEKGKTEEQFIEKLDDGDYDFLKGMIVKEVDGMKKVIDKMEDDKKRDLMIKEHQDLMNMSLMPEILEKLENLGSKNYEYEIQSFIRHCKKSLKHQQHRNWRMHSWHSHDDFLQTDFLQKAALLVENLLEDNPDDSKLKSLKADIDEKLEKYQ